MSKPMYLDPDYRKDPDTSKPYCIRCQKPIKTGKGISVSYTDEWHVVADEHGAHTIGTDCWKKINKPTA